MMSPSYSDIAAMSTSSASARATRWRIAYTRFYRNTPTGSRYRKNSCRTPTTLAPPSSRSCTTNDVTTTLAPASLTTAWPSVRARRYGRTTTPSSPTPTSRTSPSWTARRKRSKRTRLDGSGSASTPCIISRTCRVSSVGTASWFLIRTRRISGEASKTRRSRGSGSTCRNTSGSYVDSETSSNRTMTCSGAICDRMPTRSRTTARSSGSRCAPRRRPYAARSVRNTTTTGGWTYRQRFVGILLKSTANCPNSKWCLAGIDSSIHSLLKSLKIVTWKCFIMRTHRLNRINLKLCVCMLLQLEVSCLESV